MKDRYYYINILKEKLDWRISPISKTFYKPKFDWRFEFHFNDNQYDGHQYFTHRNSDWLALKDFCDANSIKYKTRIERSCAFFTKDIQAVEYIVNNDNLLKAISSVEYTSDAYKTAFTNKDEISTDIKLVAKVPEHPYLVILGQLGWKDNPTRRSLSEYLVANKNNFIFKGYYAITIERYKQGTASGLLYDGFQFYVKDFDDIMMLHLVAPGKIVKVIKLMEKGKINES